MPWYGEAICISVRREAQKIMLRKVISVSIVVLVKGCLQTHLNCVEALSLEVG